jgi:hypothetical protein
MSEREYERERGIAAQWDDSYHPFLIQFILTISDVSWDQVHRYMAKS